MTTTTTTSTFTLKVTETGNKASKFLYEIIDDATGYVISTRKSNREYVAATIDGNYFFGRLDLIGKGDHGKSLKWAKDQINQDPEKYEAKRRKLSFDGLVLDVFEVMVKKNQEAIEKINSIAYKK